MLIRREGDADLDGVHAVTVAAFRTATDDAEPVEAALLSWLRADPGWIAELSMVAVQDGAVVGHAVCTRGWVDDRPALGLGPVSVRPDRQGSCVGSALMHALLGAADARDEQLVALLGDPAYYGRFGFVPAHTVGVVAPDPAWGDYFQARPLTGFDGRGGTFTYAEPFSRL